MEIRAVTALRPGEGAGLPGGFQAWEGGRLVGTLTLAVPPGRAAEVSGFVAEEYRRQGVFTALWREAAAKAPPEYRPWLLPLGDSLSAGDRPDLINLTREEVYRAAGELRRRQRERDRLETVLCLAASLMTAAVLL